MKLSKPRLVAKKLLRLRITFSTKLIMGQMGTISLSLRENLLKIRETSGRTDSLDRRWDPCSLILPVFKQVLSLFPGIF